ncbi:ABC transporter ATP-binding protein [Mesorhizobium sp. CU2]|uniref:ABC transporter ATP-binding protein n=1 Tax=unclassified Mesorhizobium TaxID=325217 RepID=UPI0011268C7C|nr:MULTISPECIES: ABC transporter ATP-binding protein [unclassified Mesorhizobium]TPN81142.1 ABC transporter ATP-binding protein [Mesorhizobium sp. CU3]TPO17059.1 ABC transporter ATP-binding protein [Mesorhizobium sp. CU2]
MSEIRGHKVSFIEITKSYGQVVALHPANLEIEAGEVFAIIGPSGSGKSTLLGLTAGYTTPTAGEIRIDGANIADKPPFKRNIGMVFQGYSLFPHMTVAENISFPLRVRNVPKPEIATRLKRMIDLVRLSGMADRYPAALSGGQQQRVALARAAIYNPLLLLMDEPLSALDKNLRDEMQYEIKQFHQAVGSTFLYVTHDQGEAASLADRIAIMRDGRIEQIGGARELYEMPSSRFVASFLGHANIFEITDLIPKGNGVDVRTSFGAILHSSQVPGSANVCACVRPEAMSIATTTLTTDNTVAGVVEDITFITGSTRYKVRVENGPQVHLVQPTTRLLEAIAVGRRVHLGWSASDMLLVRN